MRYVKNKYGEQLERYHHVELPAKDDIEVEVHFNRRICLLRGVIEGCSGGLWNKLMGSLEIESGYRRTAQGFVLSTDNCYIAIAE